MKKTKYQHYFHCFIVCMLVPYAFYFVILVEYGNYFMVTMWRLFQRGYQKVRHLFEARRLLEEIR